MQVSSQSILVEFAVESSLSNAEQLCRLAPILIDTFQCLHNRGSFQVLQ
jgi:hypothetical protein